ncbi:MULTISPECIES: murein hydrolase activator EnvC family protein [Ralstonia]|uniref:murein hydrolase activator EnvC family protein n=1 Tax=Ralstonia TaxID=48736 RepID=UPI0009DB9747|nr:MULTISPECIES: peptidoglycan DD-metalloendopeptidase family protein [Ralstonia]
MFVGEHGPSFGVRFRLQCASRKRSTCLRWMGTVVWAASLSACTLTPWSTKLETSAHVSAGYYQVNAGDTLASVAAAFGRRPAEIAAWNGLGGQQDLQTGQVLRVAPNLQAGAVSPAKAGSKHDQHGDQPGWVWPTSGAIVEPYAAGKSGGILIRGTPGEAVKAVAAGRVVYVGSALKKYGLVVIIKHDNDFVTAYGGTGKLFVKEGETVQRGQQIAEMGSDGKTKGVLRFEVRKDGKPIDPLTVLPKPDVMDVVRP